MRRRRPSPTTLIALLALFFALGGSAVAAKHYIITSSSQIRPNVLTKIEFADRSEILVVKGPKIPIPPGEVATSVATCHEGERVVSGGASAVTLNGVSTSEASEDRRSWLVVAANSDNAPTETVQATAYCAAGRYAVAASARSAHMRALRQAQAIASHLTKRLRTGG